jgi:putative redox protein
MIKTRSEQAAYKTAFSSEQHQCIADAPLAKGGAGAGFDPHELLEAALATCINIIVRKRAVQLNIIVECVTTTVRLDRSRTDVTMFEYQLDVRGNIDAEQRAALHKAVETCPVSQTLSKRIEFRSMVDACQ